MNHQGSESLKHEIDSRHCLSSDVMNPLSQVNRVECHGTYLATIDPNSPKIHQFISSIHIFTHIAIIVHSYLHIYLK